MKKLVVFGDSCAKGIVTDSGRPLPAKPCAVDILGEKLLFDEVENISAFGQTIVKLSERKFVERYIEAIKPGDKVIVLSGKDKGKTGKVIGNLDRRERRGLRLAASCDFAGLSAFFKNRALRILRNTAQSNRKIKESQRKSIFGYSFAR